MLLNERRLQADMQKVSQAMESSISVEQKIQSELLAYHISIHVQHIRSIYIESLQNSLTSITPSEDFLSIRNLIYNRDYCYQFFCYRKQMKFLQSIHTGIIYSYLSINYMPTNQKKRRKYNLHFS